MKYGTRGELEPSRSQTAMCLMVCKRFFKMTQLISATERIYRELSRPQAQPPKPTRATADPPIALTRADVDAILQRKRSATPEELEWAISHAKALMLSDYERNELGVALSIIVAQRAKRLDRPDNPAAEFLSKVLGMGETPHGLIPREWVNRQMQMGSQAIARCRNHRPPECHCWAESRSILFQAIARPKTPESWAAERIYSFLGQLEFASRPEIERSAVRDA